jgi:hypothetical protein
MYKKPGSCPVYFYTHHLILLEIESKKREKCLIFEYGKLFKVILLLEKSGNMISLLCFVIGVKGLKAKARGLAFIIRLAVSILFALNFVCVFKKTY